MDFLRILAGITQQLMVTVYRMSPQDLRVLMLHEVTDGQVPVHPHLSISKESFAKMLDALETAQLPVVPVQQLLEGEKTPRVVITFDDVFESAFLNAVPVLQQKGIPYTVFVTDAYVDQPGFISSAQLQLLKEDPLCTIGFHANSHVLMRELNNDQIAQCVDAGNFEKKHGLSCEYFAFPYGSVYACPHRARAIAAKKGYVAVFGTINSGISTKRVFRDRRFVPRLCVNEKNWKTICNR